jgi:hypothetical protein
MPTTQCSIRRVIRCTNLRRAIVSSKLCRVLLSITTAVLCCVSRGTNQITHCAMFIDYAHRALCKDVIHCAACTDWPKLCAVGSDRTHTVSYAMTVHTPCAVPYAKTPRTGIEPKLCRVCKDRTHCDTLRRAKKRSKYT